MKIGIFYATSTGSTEAVAYKIAKALGVAEADVRDVAETAPEALGDYDLLILGSPTYGAGELQDDWYDFLEGASMLDLQGKKLAVFGVGDESMTDTFCDAAAIIADKMKDTGAERVGAFNTFPYEFGHSKAVPVDGGFAIGLLIDEVNHADATDGRVAEWVKTLIA